MKHLHPLASSYDVGLYFEANGHGTVLFKPAFVKRLREMDESALTVKASSRRDA